MMWQLASAPKVVQPKWHMGKVGLGKHVDDILNLNFRDAHWMSQGSEHE